MDARQLKRCMEMRGISQVDIAKKLGLSSASISLKFNGKRPIFLEEARVISDFLELKQTEFISIFLA